MADTEEPPVKVIKFEMDSQYMEGEVMEEGQEEWLSEGILTDDDYNPASQQSQQENSEVMASHDETMPSVSSQEMEQNLQETVEKGVEDSNIEETLNNFENEQNYGAAKIENPAPIKDEYHDELETFLIRKSDGKPIGAAPVKREEVKSNRPSDDDGNDTDDLLRVLGDGDQMKGSQIKKEKAEESSGDEDDEYIFQGSKLNANLEAAKNALRRAAAAKATPEDDFTDCSSDELHTVKKVVVTKKVIIKAVRNDSNAQEAARTSHIGQVVKLEHKPLSQSTPRPPRQHIKRTVKQTDRQSKPEGAESKVRNLNQEIAAAAPRQQTRSPERMEEELLSDPDSEEDEDSIYDELPSSDSEPMDDWFALDIRAERAGDYIPLLGDKAYKLLLEEKARVKSTLKSLKHSLSAMTETGKQQADKLRDATATVAELDAMLKAA